MFHKTILKNGLRIITVPMTGTKTAAVLVLVGTGSKYETKSTNGLSHFLEHMFFKGTKKRPNTLALSEYLDKVGGEYNAFTGQEYTGYWAKVDSSHLELALDWVSDIFLNSKLEQAEINRERSVILEELNMYLDTPMSYVGQLWNKLLYSDQPAGWPVIGQKKVINSVQQADFINYLKEHYSAENTVVVVAGDIKKVNVAAKAEKYFKSINPESAKDKLKVKEKQKKPESLVYYKKTDQTHLFLGGRAFDLFHPDKYAIGLLGTILGGNMSSRLFINVRERQGLAYYISAGAELDTDSGCFFARAGVDNKRVEQAIKSILVEFKKIAQEGVKEPELQKAKDYTIGSTLLDMESSDSQASFVGFQELLTKEILTLEQKFDKIKAVTTDDIQRVAQDIFRPEKLNLALIGPFKKEEQFQKILDNY